MEFGKKYLKYEEYKYFGGTLKETPFNILELEARKQIDKYTSGRLKSLEKQLPETKVCMYRLIENLQSYETYSKQNKAVSSESTDGYSVSYGGADENASKTKQNEIKDIIKSELAECYLDDGTPYLYVGV
jgi:hypothetical protein